MKNIAGKRDPLNSLASDEKKVAMCLRGEGGFSRTTVQSKETTLADGDSVAGG
jgi:hypothetical protein